MITADDFHIGREAVSYESFGLLCCGHWKRLGYNDHCFMGGIRNFAHASFSHFCYLLEDAIATH